MKTNGKSTDKVNGSRQSKAASESDSAKTIHNGAADPESIAHLAYSYWESRGRRGGSSEEDWYRAEQELRAPSSGARTDSEGPVA
jgi:hypothetical protein